MPVEAQAWNQVQNVARLPFVHKHVAVMPDMHWGIRRDGGFGDPHVRGG